MVKKLHVRRDDTVVVISGKDKGKQGKVLRTEPKTGRLVVESVNVVSRHQKPKSQTDVGGIIQSEAPIYASKVMLVCSKCGKATRISYKMKPDGKKIRVCKKCAAELG